MSTESRNLVLDAALAGTQRAANSPSIQMDLSAAYPVADLVAREMAPIVDHLTNNEPFYLSRVFWGAVLSATGATSALVGYPIAEEFQSQILEAITLWTGVVGMVSGPLLTLYGRFRARKPIGS